MGERRRQGGKQKGPSSRGRAGKRDAEAGEESRLPAQAHRNPGQGAVTVMGMMVGGAARKHPAA